MPSTSVQVDLRDVELVQAIEPKVRELLQAIRRAEPAFKRLDAAHYAGAGALRAEVHNMLEDGDSAPNPTELLASFKVFRDAGGDQGAHDYLELCAGEGRTIDEAAVELVDCYGTDRALEHIDGLRRYAATLAS